MKNYKFVLSVVLAGAAATGAQAANIKEPAAAPTSPIAMKDAGPVTGGVGAPYHFVDPELGTAGHATVSGPGMMPSAGMAGGMEKASAQSFAGGVVAAHASPAKSGLASTQAAANRISEPATELLLLVALSALAIAVRRQSKT